MTVYRLKQRAWAQKALHCLHDTIADSLMRVEEAETALVTQIDAVSDLEPPQTLESPH